MSLYCKGNDRETETEKLNRREEKLLGGKKETREPFRQLIGRKGVEGAESLGT